MKISLDKIALIVAIIGGGGILGWITIFKGCIRPPKGIFYYCGSVRDDNTGDLIEGAVITFPGLTPTISTRKTDSEGCFQIPLPKENSTVTVRIKHKDYETQEFYRELRNINLEHPDIFYLKPKPKEIKLEENKDVSMKESPTLPASIADIVAFKNDDVLKIDEIYESRIDSEKPSDFKLVTFEDGSLALSLELFAEYTFKLDAGSYKFRITHSQTGLSTGFYQSS